MWHEAYPQQADADIFIDGVEDNFDDGHHDHLEGAEFAEDCTEADEDCSSSEVRRDQTAGDNGRDYCVTLSRIQ